MDDLINPLDKLKKLNLEEITNKRIKDNVETMLQSYPQRDDLSTTEINVANKLYEEAVADIEEGKRRKKEEEAAARAEEERKRQEQEQIAALTEKAKKIGAAIPSNPSVEALEKAISDKEAADLNERRSQRIKEIEEMVFPHQEYIQQHNIDVESLPANIRQSLGTIEARKGKLLKEPFSENHMNALIDLSEKNKTKIEEFMDEKNKKDAEAAAAESQRTEELEALKQEKLDRLTKEAEQLGIEIPPDATIEQLEQSIAGRKDLNSQAEELGIEVRPDMGTQYLKTAIAKATQDKEAADKKAEEEYENLMRKAAELDITVKDGATAEEINALIEKKEAESAATAPAPKDVDSVRKALIKKKVLTYPELRELGIDPSGSNKIDFHGVVLRKRMWLKEYAVEKVNEPAPAPAPASKEAQSAAE